MAGYFSRIVGCGGYVPANCVSNEALSKTVDTSDEWILSRTGIEQRYLAAEGELTSDLATEAAKVALADAGLTSSDISLIIVATTTPDQTMPSTAVFVQQKLGMEQGVAFDVQAVCSGFVYALSLADTMLRDGQGKYALVIGAETFSRVLDWEDRTTCVLFGDGAGAVVLSREDVVSGEPSRGILCANMFSDGRYADLLQTDGGVSLNGQAGVLHMQGKEVFRHASTKMVECVEQLLEQQGLAVADIDWMVPHQANRRILQSVAQRLGVPEDKVIITVNRHANTSAASIPLALAQARKDRRIQDGQLVALQALGAGLTWGACLIRW